MKSEIFNIQQAYENKWQYIVPLYQRSYVWTKTNQWEPLWEDIKQKAEDRLSKDDSEIYPHFLGSIVIEAKKADLLDAKKLCVIDGQQRLTTMQYVLVAMKYAFIQISQDYSLDLQGVIDGIDTCLFNSKPRSDNEKFKIMPTCIDRENFKNAIASKTLEDLKINVGDNHFNKDGNLKKNVKHNLPSLECIMFFYEAILDFIIDTNQHNTDLEKIIHSLFYAVLVDISIVFITIDERDDAQIIFETLNGRGAELHATDLIRNYIFMNVDNDTDAEALYEQKWQCFETEFWKNETTRGRIKKPEMEWYIKALIDVETGTNADIKRLYNFYISLTKNRNLNTGEKQLSLFEKYRDCYVELVDNKTKESPLAKFGYHMKLLDFTTFNSLALFIAKHFYNDEQITLFDFLESYIIRRFICEYNTKTHTILCQSIIKDLNKFSGNITVKQFIDIVLNLKKGEWSAFPDNYQFEKYWNENLMYANLKSAKVKFILYRLEMAMAKKSEFADNNLILNLDELDVEHLLPQKWNTYWKLPNGEVITNDEQIDKIKNSIKFYKLISNPNTTEEFIINRELLLHTIGNLTLIHNKVNKEIRNYAFSDKKEKIFENTNLNLNKTLFNLQQWNEDLIKKRSKELFNYACQIWKDPESLIKLH
ncbi:MAG: DUF262 domain-containing protein [Rhodocyclaceae bacterium]